MRLTFLGHAAVQLEIGEHEVLIDPFVDGNPVASTTSETLAPSHVLLTHGHADHLGDTVALAAEHRSVVVASVEIAQWLERQGVADPIGMNLGGATTMPFGRVSLHPAWHSNSLPDGSYGGMPAGVLIEAEEATVYHAGDTALFSDLALVGRRGIDLALLPIGDHFTMGPDDALEAVRLLDPTAVVPIHDDTFPPIHQDADAFRARVEDETDARCHVLGPGDALDL
jgi:L-ascorbate metabolism protein UlaG (beta-lactamase superfamily)